MSQSKALEQLKFLTEDQVRELAEKYGTPLYVNSRDMFTQQVKNITSVNMQTALAIKYAMKANPNPEVLKLMLSLGVEIDASSGYEAELALKLGFKPEHILLTTQQIPQNLEALVKQGVEFNATSLHQLKTYAHLFPNTNISVRINPGIGSGFSRKTTTAGISAGFGIWHEYLDEVFKIVKQYKLRIRRLHTHIGAGNDVDLWKCVIDINLELLRKMPSVTVLNLGGGYKIARMLSEKSADMKSVLEALDGKMQQFKKDTGRDVHLEIEPGTYLAANSGAIICEVVDIVDTGDDGFTFIRTNTGMNDILRPALYGALQPLVVVKRTPVRKVKTREYMVIGHCCESGDSLTVAHGNSEEHEPRLLREVKIGDYIVIEGCGAYCASMSAKGYNGFPVTKEIIV